MLLGLFLAANLLPPQALLIPVFRMFRAIPVPFWFSDSGTLLNSYWGLILVNVAFQTGFCTFVLSNYMKTLPREIYESAADRRRGRAAAVLPADPAAVPAGARGAGHPAGHLDLQRVLLGDRAAPVAATSCR